MPALPTGYRAMPPMAYLPQQLAARARLTADLSTPHGGGTPKWVAPVGGSLGGALCCCLTIVAARAIDKHYGYPVDNFLGDRVDKLLPPKKVENNSSSAAPIPTGSNAGRNSQPQRPTPARIASPRHGGNNDDIAPLPRTSLFSKQQSESKGTKPRRRARSSSPFRMAGKPKA